MSEKIIGLASGPYRGSPLFASFDHTAPAPARVKGWFHTTDFAYSNMPPPADLVEMTPEQWAVRLASPWAVERGLLVAYVPPATVAQPHAVGKLVLVERLGAAGKLRAVRTALKMGAPDSDLTDAELLLRDRWDAARFVMSDDAPVRAVLVAAGADPDAMLAPA